MAIRRSGILLCLVGPAGSGKTTLSERLLQSDKSLAVSISVTSRPPRTGEVDGEHYRFVTPEVFQEYIDQGKFFEWEEIHGNRYGTLCEALDSAVKSGADLLLRIDVRGAKSCKKTYGKDTVVIFLVPPSFSILQERVLRRSTISDAELARRMKTATREYAELMSALDDGGSVDYVIVNDDLEAAYRDLASVLNAERRRLSRVNQEELHGFLSNGLDRVNFSGEL